MSFQVDRNHAGTLIAILARFEGTGAIGFRSQSNRSQVRSNEWGYTLVEGEMSQLRWYFVQKLHKVPRTMLTRHSEARPAQCEQRYVCKK